jgi:hypothetical protein
MKKLITILLTLTTLTMCSYAPAQPTIINMPDGTMISCTKFGTVINCI